MYVGFVDRLFEINIVNVTQQQIDDLVYETKQ